MAFQTKDFLSIVASEVNYMRATQSKLTDFNVGSVARTLIEAPAVEIDQLYQMMFRGLMEAIPVSVFNSFNFAPLPALAASGLVRFTVDQAPVTNAIIRAGTAVRVPGGSIVYTTTADSILLAHHSYVDILVAATTAGIASNTGANTITSLDSAVAGLTVVSVTNPAALINGADLETDFARKLRFHQYITTISRGTKAALAYGARTTALTDASGVIYERVVGVSLVEHYLVDPTEYSPGVVSLYVHNGSGGTSDALVSACQQIIDGYRKPDGTPVPGFKAAGVRVTVIKATEVSVSLGGTLTIDAGYAAAPVIAEVTANVSDYLAGLDIGVAALLAEVVYLAMAVPGVSNVAITGMTGDVLASASQKIMPGSIVFAGA